jgi:hypothetical protein
MFKKIFDKEMWKSNIFFAAEVMKKITKNFLKDNKGTCKLSIT